MSTARGDSDEALARNRMVSPDAVLRREVDLDRYPYRHLAVGAPVSRTSRLVLPRLLEAVELLAGNGWELVTVLRVDDGLTCAFMRRTESR